MGGNTRRSVGTTEKRFLRYVLPGLIFCLQLGIGAAINGKIPKDIGWDKALTGLIATFISSGVLGYIFSIIYHGIVFHIDYRIVLEPIQTMGRGFGICEKCGCFTPKSKLKDFKRLDALVIANQLWMYLAGTNNGMLELEQFAARNADILHGIGASLVGTVLGIVLWFCLWPGEGWNNKVCVGWIFIALAMFFNYLRLRKYVTRYCNSSLMSVMSSVENNDILKKIYYL